MAEEETPNGPEEPETTQGMDVVEDGDKEEQAAEKKDEKKEPKKNKPRKRRKQNITGRKVQVYGKKKKAMAIALCGDGHGMIRVNGRPLDILNPKPMRLKAYEPLLLVGRDKFQDLDIHVRVRGGGPVAQVYGMKYSSFPFDTPFDIPSTTYRVNSLYLNLHRLASSQ